MVRYRIACGKGTKRRVTPRDFYSKKSAKKMVEKIKKSEAILIRKCPNPRIVKV